MISPQKWQFRLKIKVLKFLGTQPRYITCFKSDFQIFDGFCIKFTNFHVFSSVAFYESRDYFGFWSFKVRINRKDETEALKVSIVVLIQLTLNRIHHPFNITNHFWYRVARCPRDNHHKCHLSGHPSKAIKTNIQYIMNLESFFV